MEELSGMMPLPFGGGADAGEDGMGFGSFLRSRAEGELPEDDEEANGLLGVVVGVLNTGVHEEREEPVSFGVE